MNLKNNIKSKQIQTVRHNPDKDSCFKIVSRVTSIVSYLQNEWTGNNLMGSPYNAKYRYLVHYSTATVQKPWC